MRSYKVFGMHNLWALQLKKNPLKAAKVEILVKFFNVGKMQACYAFLNCHVQIFPPPLPTHSCLRVFFSEAAIIIFK